jgi:hypothetical protein
MYVRQTVSQVMFYLAKFDALASHFDLAILAAQEYQVAIGSPVGQVSRLVQTALATLVPPIATEQPGRVLNKRCSGLLGVVEVSTGKNRAFNQELTDGTQWRKLAIVLWVHQPNVRSNRLSDKSSGKIIDAKICSAENTSLGRTIGVDDLDRVSPPVAVRLAYHLTSEYDGLQR